MAKFHGKVGYISEQKETAPSVYENIVTEREYFGETLRVARKLERGVDLNDDLSSSTIFSIVADDYLLEHFADIRYIWWMHVCWKVVSVENTRPRVVLNIGGVYNGPKAST